MIFQLQFLWPWFLGHVLWLWCPMLGHEGLDHVWWPCLHEGEEIACHVLTTGAGCGLTEFPWEHPVQPYGPWYPPDPLWHPVHLPVPDRSPGHPAICRLQRFRVFGFVSSLFNCLEGTDLCRVFEIQLPINRVN